LENYDQVDVLFDEMRRVPTKRGAEGTAEGLDAFLGRTTPSQGNQFMIIPWWAC